MTRDPKQITERTIGLGAVCVLLLAPALFSDYWVDVILTQTLIVGIASPPIESPPIESRPLESQSVESLSTIARIES